MTYTDDSTLTTELLEQISQEGLEYLPELIRILVNAAMQAERQKHLGAELYERSPQRRGYANGYKPKTVKTRVGEITFDVPQVRDGSFYPDALEKGLCSERALTMTLAEMYVQCVSTRRVAAITGQLCGTAVTSSAVSRATTQLDRGPFWSPCFRPGGSGHWQRSHTCTWTPATRRSARMARCGMRPFCWPPACPLRANARSWEFPWRSAKRKRIGAASCTAWWREG